MKVVVDAHKAIGKDRKGFGSPGQDPHAQQRRQEREDLLRHQAGISGTGRETRGLSRRLPDGLRSGNRPALEVYPIPVPHEGISSITPDEELGVAYISTCSDHRPGPQENAHFLVLDLEKGKYRDLIDTQHIFAFIVVDYLHRAYHPMLGGDMLRYDPRAGRLERLKQTIDGKPPTPASHLADPEGHPINWDISPGRQDAVFAADEHEPAFRLRSDAEGRHAGGPQPGRADSRGRGHRLPGHVRRSDGHGLGRHHRVTSESAICCTWSATTPETRRRATTAPSRFATRITRSTDSAGKPLPYPSGMIKLADGTITTRHVIWASARQETAMCSPGSCALHGAAGRFQRDSLKVCRQF